MEDASIQLAQRYSKAVVAALGLLAGGFLMTAPAAAQSAQQLRWCNNEDGATSDMAIGGCTALIKSGNFSGRDLAIAYTNRGSAYDDKRDEDRAIADHDQAIRIDPKLDLAYNNRANAHSRKGEEDRAIADYDAAIRLNPKFAMAYNNRGTSYRHKRDYGRAIADYDAAIGINPGFADAYNNRGIAYDAMGDKERALADYTSAIRVDPKYAIAYNNRGLIHREKGEYDAAIADFDKAIAINVRYTGAYRNRGNAYVKKGDYAQAILDLSIVLAIDDRDTETYAVRGVAYQQTGDYDFGDRRFRQHPRDHSAGCWRAQQSRLCAFLSRRLRSRSRRSVACQFDGSLSRPVPLPGAIARRAACFRPRSRGAALDRQGLAVSGIRALSRTD